MILITSISVQDKLDYNGRRKAYVMELAGPHSADEFVIEIGEEIYQKLLQVYEVNGSSLPGPPATVEAATRPAPPPPPSVTPEEFDLVRRKLIEEESRHSSIVPEEFAGRSLSQDEANLLVGIGVDFAGGSQFGDASDGDDEGELLDEDADQL